MLRSAVESPCTGFCVLDTQTQCCSGCWRSCDEVAAWSTASDDERRAILGRAEVRRRAAERRAEAARAR